MSSAKRPLVLCLGCICKSDGDGECRSCGVTGRGCECEICAPVVESCDGSHGGESCGYDCAKFCGGRGGMGAECGCGVCVVGRYDCAKCGGEDVETGDGQTCERGGVGACGGAVRWVRS